MLLCDPGYHVGRVVTVMEDRTYPHTGWFIQSEDEQSRKEYCYNFSAINDSFVEWTERNTVGDMSKSFSSLVYVEREYLTAVDVTERRNLVYNFRSLLSRDPKGNLIAGFYFKLKEDFDEFTLFYQDNVKQRVKFNFVTFLTPSDISSDVMKVIRKCNDQLNLPDGRLLEMLTKIARLMQDRKYLRWLLKINNSINMMTEVN